VHNFDTKSGKERYLPFFEKKSKLFMHFFCAWLLHCRWNMTTGEFVSSLSFEMAASSSRRHQQQQHAINPNTVLLINDQDNDLHCVDQVFCCCNAELRELFVPAVSIL